MFTGMMEYHVYLIFNKGAKIPTMEYYLQNKIMIDMFRMIPMKEYMFKEQRL